MIIEDSRSEWVRIQEGPSIDWVALSRVLKASILFKVTFENNWISRWFWMNESSISKEGRFKYWINSW